MKTDENKKKRYLHNTTRLMLTHANQLGKYCVRKTKVHFTDTVQTVSSISHAVTKILTILDKKERLRLISNIDIRQGDFYFWIIIVRKERLCCYYLCKVYN